MSLTNAPTPDPMYTETKSLAATWKLWFLKIVGYINGHVDIVNGNPHGAEFVQLNDVTVTTGSVSLDISTNDLVIVCGTEKTVVLDNPVWVDVDFPILIRTTGPNIPVQTTVLGNLTMPQWAINDFNVCEIQEITHQWSEGSDIRWHLHIITAVQDATDRNVNFEVEFNYANIFKAGAYAADQSWQGTNTVVTSGNFTIPANTAVRTNIIIPIYTWANTAGRIGAHVKARLKRIAATSGTAPSASPFCEMLQMHILCDTQGSRQIGTK